MLTCAHAQLNVVEPREGGSAGSLRIVGSYPYDVVPYSISATTDGKLLLYGVAPVEIDSKNPQATLERRRNAASSGGLQSEALMWSPQHRGWKQLGSPRECQQNRYLHTMTALPSGKILIAGGLCDSAKMGDDPTPYPVFASLSLWNGATLQWEPAPSLSVARMLHTATLLKDGSVMLAGGENDPGVDKPAQRLLASVESYREGVMAQLAPLRTARARHTATLLADGSVVVAGGIDEGGKPINSVEIWDSQKQSWRDGPPLTTARNKHSATLLRDGRLMIAGGRGANGEALSSVEIWDPVTATWSPGRPLLYPLLAHSAALLADGDVLITGGYTIKNTPVARVMLFQKSSGQWLPAGSAAPEQLSKTFPAMSIVTGPDGSAHIFGLRRIFQWLPTKNLANTYPAYGERDLFASTLLNDGRVLLSGGIMTSLLSDISGSPILDAAEIYDPRSGRYAVTGRMNLTRLMHSAIALDDGRAVAAGGWVWARDNFGKSVANSPEVWDPKTGVWSIISEIRFEAHDWVHLGKLQDGRVLFFASSEADEAKPSGQTPYRAWLWNPQSGSVETKSVRAKPHSGAAIAILPDGRVLRVGGNLRSFVGGRPCPPARPAADKPAEPASTCQEEPARWNDQADSSAEVWDSRSGNVSSMPAPPGWNGRLGKTLTLHNGNVLLVEHRPAHILNNRVPPPAALLVWDAQAEKWQSLPALTTDLTWPMLELQDGSLLTRTHVLPLAAPAWRAALLPLEDMATLTLLGTGRALALSSTRPYAALFDENAGRWQVRAPVDAVPAWQGKPATVMLRDGRVMVVAQVEAKQTGLPTAHIWHPQTDRWSIAGRLNRRAGADTQAILLPSGRVMHIAISDKNIMNCEIWQEGDNTWEACGELVISGAFSTPPALGLLEDGRVVLVAGPDAVFVFDERGRQWVAMKAEWKTLQLTYGTPIRSDQPMQRIFDEQKQEWFDISDIGARYWEKVTPHRTYAVSFSDRPTQVREGVSLPPHMLWDPKKKQWAYIFLQSNMGRHAQFLPDGCAFSWQGFSLFNPSTGRVTELTNPGTGIQRGEGSMVILADGTVVIAGTPDGTGGPDSGFFHRKVSCTGFAVHPEDAGLMHGILYAENPAAVATAAVTPTPWWQQSRHFLVEYKWLFLAVLGPVALYFLLRFVVLPVASGATTLFLAHVVPERAAKMLQRQLPRPFSWGSRILLYGLLLIVCYLILFPYIQFRSARIAEACAENASTCLDQKTGILQSIAALENAATGHAAKPAIPCRFIGAWTSRQGNGPVYRIILKDDGTYIQEPNQVIGGQANTGYWMVQSGNMVWRHKTGMNTGEPDINPITIESETRFMLKEQSGRFTQFELIEAVKSTRCTPYVSP